MIRGAEVTPFDRAASSVSFVILVPPFRDQLDHGVAERITHQCARPPPSFVATRAGSQLSISPVIGWRFISSALDGADRHDAEVVGSNPVTPGRPAQPSRQRLTGVVYRRQRLHLRVLL